MNETGHESANATMTEGRDLAWLQEGASDGVWAAWEVAYRDVIVVDRDGGRAVTFNLTTHDLAVPENYAYLKGLIEDVLAE